MTFSECVLNKFHQLQDEWFERTKIRLDDDEFLTFLINTTKQRSSMRFSADVYKK